MLLCDVRRLAALLQDCRCKNWRAVIGQFVSSRYVLDNNSLHGFLLFYKRYRREYFYEYDFDIIDFTIKYCKASGKPTRKLASENIESEMVIPQSLERSSSDTDCAYQSLKHKNTMSIDAQLKKKIKDHAKCVEIEVTADELDLELDRESESTLKSHSEQSEVAITSDIGSNVDTNDSAKSSQSFSEHTHSPQDKASGSNKRRGRTDVYQLTASQAEVVNSTYNEIEAYLKKQCEDAFPAIKRTMNAVKCKKFSVLVHNKLFSNVDERAKLFILSYCTANFINGGVPALHEFLKSPILMRGAATFVRDQMEMRSIGVEDYAILMIKDVEQLCKFRNCCPKCSVPPAPVSVSSSEPRKKKKK